MAKRRASAGPSRYLAPGAFLLAVTIAVLLIRAGLSGNGTPATTLGPVATHPATTRATTTSAAAATSTGATTTTAAVYYTVQSGDTFGSIASKSGTTVAQIEQLNPGVSSNALHVGQKIRVK
jgi:LysM repeat protein